MSDSAQNPRAVVGDNRDPEIAKRVAEQMARDYAGLVENVSALLDEARKLPHQIPDDADEETLGRFANVIKNLRDAAKRIEGFHEAEKAPHLRAGQAVDGFFFTLWDKVIRRDRKKNPGAADILQARVDDYVQRKIAAEAERRRQALAEADRLAREAAAKAEAERRAAEEARLAAERARKPEHIETKQSAAAVAETAAAVAAATAQVAATRAEDAYVDTLAKPADMVRTRVGEGAILTAGTVPYSLIENDNLLDRDALWPFISLEAKQKALNAWAKTTNYNKPMPGAAIGRKARGQVR
jgi:hypothetical protein